jgi:hypothetical protein
MINGSEDLDLLKINTCFFGKVGRVAASLRSNSASDLLSLGMIPEYLNKTESARLSLEDSVEI